LEAELEKARLEDDLAKKLAERPKPDELIKEHILQGKSGMCELALMVCS
jgi:hypothetical protein